MDSLQRDMGRVEAKVEIIQTDISSIKKDLLAIKNEVLSKKAIVDSDWKRLALFGTIITLVNQMITWVKPFT